MVLMYYHVLTQSEIHFIPVGHANHSSTVVAVVAVSAPEGVDRFHDGEGAVSCLPNKCQELPKYSTEHLRGQYTCEVLKIFGCNWPKFGNLFTLHQGSPFREQAQTRTSYVFAPLSLLWGHSLSQSSDHPDHVVWFGHFHIKKGLHGLAATLRC